MLLFLLACVSVVDMPMNEPEPRLSSISAPMVIPGDAVNQPTLMKEDGDGALFQVWVECYGAGDEVEFTLLEPVSGLLFGEALSPMSCSLKDQKTADDRALCPDNYTKGLGRELEDGYAHVWIFLDANYFVLDSESYVKFAPVDLRVHYGDATTFVTIDVSSAGAAL